MSPRLGFLDDLDQTLEHIVVRRRVAGLLCVFQVLAADGVADAVEVVHRVDGGTLVEEIDQDEGRRLAPLALALLRGVAEIALAAARRVGRGDVARVRVLNVDDA